MLKFISVSFAFISKGPRFTSKQNCSALNSSDSELRAGVFVDNLDVIVPLQIQLSGFIDVLFCRTPFEIFKSIVPFVRIDLLPFASSAHLLGKSLRLVPPLNRPDIRTGLAHPANLVLLQTA